MRSSGGAGSHRSLRTDGDGHQPLTRLARGRASVTKGGQGLSLCRNRGNVALLCSALPERRQPFPEHLTNEGGAAGQGGRMGGAHFRPILALEGSSHELALHSSSCSGLTRDSGSSRRPWAQQCSDLLRADRESTRTRTHTHIKPDSTAAGNPWKEYRGPGVSLG